MPEPATTTSLAYTNRSIGGATEAEGNVPETRDGLESMMRGSNSPCTASGGCGALREAIFQQLRRLSGPISRRRAERTGAGGGRALPVYD
jgi:hypothetical protein